MGKHFLNALVYDICNWAVNIATVTFIWSISHFFTIAIVGLVILRHFADFFYRKSMYAEQLEARAKIMATFDAPDDFRENVTPIKPNKDIH